MWRWLIPGASTVGEGAGTSIAQVPRDPTRPPPRGLYISPVLDLRKKNQVWKIPNGNTNFKPIAATLEYMSLLGKL